ncbi:MAG: hypothetical protein HMLKMBBP_00308 [Planctomycetes bacterium]|nr:hypothetical protein [Planctomycetota bacterium]
MIGDAAERTGRNAVRGAPVVPVSVLPPVSGSTDAAVAGGPAPADLIRLVSAAVPDPRLVAYVLPPEGAVPTGLAPEFRPVRLSGATPRERAAAARSQLVPARDAVVLDARVTDDDAAALASVLAASGTPLVGLRKGQLDAGCAAVIRSRGKDVGAVAAVASADAREGRAPRNAPPRTPRGVLREIHLGHARRIGWTPPLTLLAVADRVVPAGDVLR